MACLLTRRVERVLMRVFDAGVMGWRATDLSGNDAHQQAADLNVIFNQYGQRKRRRSSRSGPADRGGGAHLVDWSAARLLDQGTPVVVGPGTRSRRSPSVAQSR
jgi:hypothetical protein